MAMLAPATRVLAQTATLAGAAPAPVSLDAPALEARANPDGLTFGAFVVQPSLKLSSAYDDNIFARETDRIGDVTFTVHPSIAVQSNWLNNALSFNASTIHTRYATYTANNSDQYQASGDGSLTLTRLWSVGGSINYGHLIEARGTPGNDFTIGRFGYVDNLNVAARSSLRIDRLLLTGTAGTNRLHYDDVTQGAATIDQSYRNHRVQTALLRGDYQIDSTTTVFLSTSVDRYSYAHRIQARDRSSTGVSILVGINGELTRLLKGEIGIGYVEQNYRQAGFNSYRGFNYTADLTYSLTALTTITFDANRSLLNSTIANVANVISSQFRLSAEHELTRTVTLQASAEHDTDQYQGISRTDDRLQLSFSANYVLNRFVTFAPYFTYRDRSSHGDLRGRSYHDNRIGASLILTP